MSAKIQGRVLADSSIPTIDPHRHWALRGRMVASNKVTHTNTAIIMDREVVIKLNFTAETTCSCINGWQYYQHDQLKIHARSSQSTRPNLEDLHDYPKASIL